VSTELQVSPDKPLTIAERVTRALAGTKSEKDLKALAASTADIKAVTNKDGREQVHAAMMVLKRERTTIASLCKKARDDANTFSKGVIAAERTLIGLIEPEETRLEKLRDGWDADREAERQAAIAAEEQRVEALEERVAELRGNRMLSPTSGSNLIGQHIEDVERITVDDSFQEYRNQAEEAKAGGLAWLRELHAAALAHEAEQARLKAEREELARLRREEQERQAAERARIAEEERQARVAREAEAARQAAELRMQREAQEAENARVRAEQEAAARAERERIAEERAALAREQEALRKAQEPPPAPPPPPPAPVSRRGVAVPVPKAAEMIEVLAKHYRARPDTIIEWLRAIDWKQAEAA
jgi:hypothetical protein